MSRRIKAWAADIASRQGPWVEVGIPLATLFGLTVLAHGLWIPWLGFYWDDMPKSWFLHSLGPMGFWQVYAHDRPFLPWIYMLTTPILGESPLGWQTLELMARYLAGVGVWWLMRSIWPRRQTLALASAMFFLVYPGFLQGPISLIYSHYFLLYGMFIASMALMVLAQRGVRRGRLMTASALVMLALSLFSFEYFAGLEFARPAVILLVAWNQGLRGRQLARQGLKTWLPYAAVLVAYLFWRSVIFRFPSYEPELLDALATEAGAAITLLGSKIIADLEVATSGAWRKALDLPTLKEIGRLGMAAIAVAIVLTFTLCAWALFYVRRRSHAAGGDSLEGRGRDTGQAILLGFWATWVAGLPIWITLLPIQIRFPWDRLTLPFMFGASILAGALILWLLGRWRVGLVIVALLVALAAGSHVRNAQSYATAWQALNNFLWQLTWRIPALEPGTVILANDIPLKYYTDNSLTGPLNWTYAPGHDTTELPYMFYFVSVRLGRGLEALRTGLPIRQGYRAGTFNGTTSQALALYYKPYDCLQVLDARLHRFMPGLPDKLERAVPLSRLDLIQTDPARPAQPPFGVEPQPTWCYYFERADLARQRGDWQSVADLAEQAGAAGFSPHAASEFLPFVEAQAHLGQWEKAVEWTRGALAQDADVAPMACQTWLRIAGETSPSILRTESLAIARELTDCPQLRME